MIDDLLEKISLSSDYYIYVNGSFDHNFSIFNSPSFISLHSDKYISTLVFTLHRGSSNEVFGVCHFGRTDNNVFRSPSNGSYGGFEFLPCIKLEIIDQFIFNVIKYLESQSPKEIQIKLSPDIYDSRQNSIVISSLWRMKFQVYLHELNQFINVSEYSFDSSINRGNKKRIKRAISEDLKFMKLKFDDQIHAYDVIKNNRTRKGFPITMSWESLREMSCMFPDKLHFFGVYSKNSLIASSVSIEVKEDVLYVFYWGEISGFEALSPIAFLSDNIVKFADKNNFRIVDIGISTVHGDPNYGLHTFKTNIGCTTCSKYILSKKFSHFVQ